MGDGSLKSGGYWWWLVGLMWTEVQKPSLSISRNVIWEGADGPFELDSRVIVEAHKKKGEGSRDHESTTRRYQ